MKIATTTTCDLSEKEIDLFMTAMARARGISTWGEEHKDELPESAKPLAEEADKVACVIRDFLEWMCVEVDDLEWDYDDKDYKEYKGEC